MDKTFAFTMIGFFIICACFLSWAALGGPKRSIACRWLAVGYVALVWSCIVALAVMVYIY